MSFKQQELQTNLLFVHLAAAVGVEPRVSGRSCRHSRQSCWLENFEVGSELLYS